MSSKGLLYQGGVKHKLEGMKEAAAEHQKRVEQVMQGLTESEGLDPQSIRQHAQETSQKASQMMQTSLEKTSIPLTRLNSYILRKVVKSRTMKYWTS